MWKSIKKFFKWIADHTGISWILGKLGWKNHQSTGQEEDFVFLDMPQSEAPAKGKTKHNVLLKFVDGKIKLVTSAENYETLQEHFKNKRGDSTVIDDEFCLNLNNDKQLYITGRYDSKTTMKSGNIRLSINSVGTLDGKEVYGDNEPEKMKGLLDLSDKKKVYRNKSQCT
ncbi:hypothetical protein [Wolbachia endosymbiont of Armadillidium arcangelii]|uniref:Uncharacterized protein n=1 Tax=Wolbachia endosymbiont of Armadillidium arcangelii TaxID=3158571 RepID=A0AAU7Q3T9_9RICK